MSHPKTLSYLEHPELFVTRLTAVSTASFAIADAIMLPRVPMIMSGVQGASFGFILGSGIVGLTYVRQNDDKWSVIFPTTVAKIVDGVAFCPRYRFPLAASIGVLYGGAMFGILYLLDKYYDATPPE